MSAYRQQKARPTQAYEDTRSMSATHPDSKIPTLPDVHNNRGQSRAYHERDNYTTTSTYPDRLNPPTGMEPGARSTSAYQYDDVPVDTHYYDEQGVRHQVVDTGEYQDTSYLRPGYVAARELDIEMQRMDNEKAAKEQRENEERRRKNPLVEGPNTSLELLIAQVERLMREYEQNAQYADAERTRQHLENLKRRKHDFSRRELELLQEEDIRAFFQSVVEQQRKFDRLWAARLVEHKLRADDLISALKRKQQEQQEELYRQLQQRRIPRFSVELLNMRKRQVLLARGKKYVEADEIRRKADQMELVELDKIRRVARKQNLAQFEALLKKQQYERHNLADKLRDERMRLLELKAQDFLAMRNRLKNAELALKRTHMRQGLVADGKLAPMFSTLNKQRVLQQQKSNSKNSKPLALRNLRDIHEDEERKRNDEMLLDGLRQQLDQLRLMDQEADAAVAAANADEYGMWNSANYYDEEREYGDEQNTTHNTNNTSHHQQLGREHNNHTIDNNNRNQHPNNERKLSLDALLDLSQQQQNQPQQEPPQSSQQPSQPHPHQPYQNQHAKYNSLRANTGGIYANNNVDEYDHSPQQIAMVMEQKRNEQNDMVETNDGPDPLHI